MVLPVEPSGDVRQSTKDVLQVDNLAKKMSLGIKKSSFLLRKGCLHTMVTLYI
jgi:hypothetical protein